MNAREAYDEAYALWVAASAAYHDAVDAWERAAKAAVIEGALAFVASLPGDERRRYRARKAYRVLADGSRGADERQSAAYRLLDADTFEVLAAPHRAEGDALSARWQAVRPALDAALTEAAQAAPIAAGPEREVRTVWTSTYSTQGYGASRYARASADMAASELRTLGVDARIERRVLPGAPAARGPWSTYEPGEHFVVLAHLASIADVELVRRRKVPLRAWVAACWAAGVNPRVYDPFLPAGLEERLGLDYQGRDVSPARVPARGQEAAS